VNLLRRTISWIRFRGASSKLRAERVALCDWINRQNSQSSASPGEPAALTTHSALQMGNDFCRARQDCSRAAPTKLLSPTRCEKAAWRRAGQPSSGRVAVAMMETMAWRSACSGNQLRVHCDFCIQNTGDRTACFRSLSGFLEFRFVSTGNLDGNVEVRGSDGETGIRLV
jgi:hypothetical protein